MAAARKLSASYVGYCPALLPSLSTKMLTLAFLDQLDARLLDMTMYAGKKTVVTVRERGQDRFEYRIAGKPGHAGILYFDTVDNQVPIDCPPGGQVIYSCSHKMTPMSISAVMRFFESRVGTAFDLFSKSVEDDHAMLTREAMVTKAFFIT